MKIYEHSSRISALRIILMVFFIAAINIQSFSQNQEELLKGKWMLDYELTKANLDDANETRLSKMDPVRRDHINQLYRGRTIFFLLNGVYQQQLSSGKTLRAQWVYEHTIGRIKLTTDSGVGKAIEIVELTNSKLVLKYIDQAKGMFFKTLYYTKIP